MGALGDVHAAAFVAALQVAASNGLRGLMAGELADNPEVGAIVAHVDADGSIDVQLLSTSGIPIGGYSL